jgi:hypothetical protein
MLFPRAKSLLISEDTFVRSILSKSHSDQVQSLFAFIAHSCQPQHLCIHHASISGPVPTHDLTSSLLELYHANDRGSLRTVTVHGAGLGRIHGLSGVDYSLSLYATSNPDEPIRSSNNLQVSVPRTWDLIPSDLCLYHMTTVQNLIRTKVDHAFRAARPWPRTPIGSVTVFNVEGHWTRSGDTVANRSWAQSEMDRWVNEEFSASRGYPPGFAEHLGQKIKLEAWFRKGYYICRTCRRKLGVYRPR